MPVTYLESLVRAFSRILSLLKTHWQAGLPQTRLILVDTAREAVRRRLALGETKRTDEGRVRARDGGSESEEEWLETRFFRFC